MAGDDAGEEVTEDPGDAWKSDASTFARRPLSRKSFCCDMSMSTWTFLAPSSLRSISHSLESLFVAKSRACGWTGEWKASHHSGVVVRKTLPVQGRQTVRPRVWRLRKCPLSVSTAYLMIVSSFSSASHMSVARSSFNSRDSLLSLSSSSP